MTDIGNKTIKKVLEIGGYFGLDIPEHGDPFPEMFKLQSGRAALRTIVENSCIEKIYVPAYICHSAIKAIMDTGVIIEKYFLDDALYPNNLHGFNTEQSIMLYVNYFGLCDHNVSRLIEDFSRENLVVDNCQALFAKPEDVYATFYSPRKFLGVPDGGLLVTSHLNFKVPKNEDTLSIDRMKHLLLRLAYTANKGFSDYLASEKSLDNTKPLKMSLLTKRILSSINTKNIKKRRRDNFFTLSARLDKYNLHKWIINSDSVPLCYPLMLDYEIQYLRTKLQKRGIYIPTYWPDTIYEASNSIEYRLRNCCLPLPCDQRYTVEDMSYIADEVISRLS